MSERSYQRALLLAPMLYFPGIFMGVNKLASGEEFSHLDALLIGFGFGALAMQWLVVFAANGIFRDEKDSDK